MSKKVRPKRKTVKVRPEITALRKAIKETFSVNTPLAMQTHAFREYLKVLYPDWEEWKIKEDENM